MSRHYRIPFLLLAVIALGSRAGAVETEGSGPADGPLTLWYTKPAAKWMEALPVGNGRLGAMVFGQPQKDRLQLNDVTVWSGGPQPDADRKDAYKNLPEIRRAIREGKYDLAERLCAKGFNSDAPYNASYQTLGDLAFDFALPAGEVRDYRRQLDLARAVAGVTFSAGGVRFTREVFASAPDGVLVERLAADRKGAIGFSMKLSRVERAKTRFEAPDTLVMAGDAGGALRYEARARVVAEGGTVTGDGDRLTVKDADAVTVLLTAATTYALDPDKKYEGGDLSVARTRMDAAAAKSYDALKAAHVADYRRYFDRVRLDLGPADASRPTDERLKAYHDRPDPSFAALFYQFGRYLLISSSRPDDPLPANLQGIWADGVKPPWNCDYHTNINVQMNYWAAEPANLSETHLPMLRLIQGLAGPGARTAKAYFGPDTPGWVLSYTTNAWGWTSPGKGMPWGVWFGGSGWMCQHLFEHYAFTRDKDYLRSVYPTMKGAAAFWLANLVEGADGKLITSPSTSPENSFITDSGMKSTVCEGATMDKSIVWDLLTNTAQAAAVLGVDEDFRKKVEAARDRIRPIQVGKAGQVEEWGGDWDLNSKDPHHRHVSHLFGLHPGHEISALGTPDLAAAARKTLELRGDDGTGWSLAWKVNFWARLHDGDHACRLMANQLRFTEQEKTIMAGAGGTYANLFDAHPPFQIDGNFGFVSGVDEMLLQSQERYVDPAAPGEDRYYVDVLPALPHAWADGSAKGLRARGGFEVDLSWRGGRLQAAAIRSVAGTACQVRYAGKTLPLSMKPGESVTLDGTLSR